MKSVSFFINRRPDCEELLKYQFIQNHIERFDQEKNCLISIITFFDWNNWHEEYRDDRTDYYDSDRDSLEVSE
uniref:Uncharacterized protein n=1 Tax=Acrobeloides nanus TaxID=290746 RepID=A0A914EKI4_9BILA